MRFTTRWGLFCLVAVLGLSLPGAAIGEPPASPRVDLDVMRELAERIGRAAEAMTDLVLFQNDAGRTEDATESIESLGALEKQLERICGDLEAASDALTMRARKHLESGETAAARDVLAEQEKVAALEKELRVRLAALQRLRGSFAKSGKSSTGGKDPLKREVAEWFGSRPGAARHSTFVRQGLEWLKRHQHKDGYWDSDAFGAACSDERCGGPGQSIYDPGVTGLALLAYLGAGESHEAGQYRLTVKAGLDFLKTIQDADGCFGARTGHFTYNHACAALAMVEAYALTGSPLYKRSAQLGVAFIERCQNPHLAWRYDVRPKDNDTSVTGWMVSVLFAAKNAGLVVSDKPFAGARNWMNNVTDESGKVGYTQRGNGPARPAEVMDKFPADRSESLTAAGVLIRTMLGESHSDEVEKGVDLCLKVLPRWDPKSGSIDMYYWYYGSMAMHQAAGKSWKTWKSALETALHESQRGEGCAKGSWDPVGPWGNDGGRVYSTALCLLALETETRHGRIAGRK